LFFFLFAVGEPEPKPIPTMLQSAPTSPCRVVVWAWMVS
jgi:hypothetical protein